MTGTGSGGGSARASGALAGVLIAGGASTRFGQDKALLVHRGRTLAHHHFEAMRQAGLAPLVFNGPALPPDAGEGVRLIPDAQPGLGPLGGLATVLAELEMPVLAVACDMPGLTAEALSALRKAWRLGKGGLVAFGAGGLHPLCAIYEPSLLPAMRLALSQGHRALHKLVEEQGLPHFTDLDEAWVANVNSPAEWERWKRENA